MPPKKNLKLLAVRLRRIFGLFAGAFLAACGGENRSNYLKNTAPKIKKSPRSEVKVPRSGTCGGSSRLLAGAPTLLLGVARGRPAPTPVVRSPALVPEAGILRVEVPPLAHLAQTQVELLVGAIRRRVRRERVGHLSKLSPDLHFSLPLRRFHILCFNYSKKHYFCQ